MHLFPLAIMIESLSLLYILTKLFVTIDKRVNDLPENSKTFIHVGELNTVAVILIGRTLANPIGKVKNQLYFDECFTQGENKSPHPIMDSQEKM